jgi:glutamyl-tRNA reductase
MKLILAGLDYTTAPVEVRERLAFDSTAMGEALVRLTRPNGEQPPILVEAVILSTCNRVEIYGLAEAATSARDLAHFLASFHQLDEREFADAMFSHQGAAVARHLCAIAAGLRSLVLGEAQIQGQVRSSFEQGQLAGSVGPVLHRLFQHALTAGKRARSETTLGQGAASVSQAGVELARRLGPLQGRSVLLVGGGEVSELAAQNLLANGANRLTIVNRTLARGRELAGRYGAEALAFDELPQALARCDIVISSTAAPAPIILREQVAAALEAKAGRSAPGDMGGATMLLIDLAVPRDIDPEVATLPGAHLYTVDDLQDVVQATLGQRAQAVERAEAIAEEEVAAFEAWLRTQEAVPALTMLREQAERLRATEVERAMRRLSDISPEQRVLIDGLTRSIVNKLLHSPTRRLRDAAAQGDGQRFAAIVTELFNLESV